MLQHLRADVRYALKWLRRSPAFTAVAVGSLAIGIGFNTALFSVVDALLLRPLPIERPDRLVDVYTRGGDGDTYATSSYPDYLDFRAQNQVFDDVLAYSPAFAAVKAGDRSRMALAETVTGNYFQVLGLSAAAGRTLLPDDDRSSAQRVVMLSHAMWQREYAGDPAALGKTIDVHGQPYTIVGIAPQQFTGLLPLLQPDLWLPLAWVEEVEPAGIQDSVPSPTGRTRLERRGQRWLFIKGRLKDGATTAQALANLKLIMEQLAAAHPKTNNERPIAVAANVRIHPEADQMLKTIAAGLMLGVGLVLLVACANVANMLLARASGRQREIGIRLAIGASRGRLIRQLLTESLVLGLLGALAGVTLAALLLQLVHAVPVPLPVAIGLALSIDGRVLLFMIATALLAGLIAGLVPALRATRPNLSSELKGEQTSLSTGRRRWTFRDGLVAMQTAVTLVLLVAAGLLTRSIFEARQIDLGFRSAGVAALTVELSLIGYDDARATVVLNQALEHIRALPGVESAARATRQPLSINYNRASVFLPDHHQPGDQGSIVAVTSVDIPYFDTIGVPLLRGRHFTTGDTASSTQVAIVNDTFVRRYWTGSDPIGRRFRMRGLDGPEYEVVGVVADYKVETIGERPTPYIHYPVAQRPATVGVLLARTRTDAAALLPAMQRQVLALEPGAVFIESQTMDAQVDARLLPARLAAQTAALVGLVATGLGAVGLYGVVAYAVARRTREIGIRMALGAAPGGVIALVMRQGLSVAACGLVVGTLLAWPAAKAIAASLYGISAFDPGAWTGAIGVLLLSAAVANFVPASRAAKIDPCLALRSE